jgi:hypothetical protein
MSALSTAVMTSEVLAFPVAPSTLSYSASKESPAPPAQSVTFSKNSIVPKPWTTSSDVTWITISPSTGTIAREQDQITVQVNATGLPIGTYSGNVRIAIEDKRGRTQIMPVPVTLVVGGGTPTPTPSMLLNPVSLNFSGTAGGAVPSAKTFTLTNQTGGTLTWTLTKSAAWLGLNVTTGTTTNEIDSISASITTNGLAAGTYSAAITVAASGASNSPQVIPVTLALSPPTTIGTATLTWAPNLESDLSGYNVYMGTQPGIYGAPISVGMTTSYTVGGLTSGKTYFFSVTAINNMGNESLPSTEVSKPVL